MKFKPDRCPKCGTSPTGTLETIEGLAGLGPGRPGEFEYTGDTDVDWNSQMSVLTGKKVTLVCQNSHDWLASRKE